jgi:hypothetical protein
MGRMRTKTRNRTKQKVEIIIPAFKCKGLICRKGEPSNMKTLEPSSMKGVRLKVRMALPMIGFVRIALQNLYSGTIIKKSKMSLTNQMAEIAYSTNLTIRSEKKSETDTKTNAQRK